jgi:ElaA protein
MPGFLPRIHVFFTLSPRGLEIATMSGSPDRHAWRSFAQLSAEELYALLRLRNEVFIVEQRCAYQDIDGNDPRADHLLAWDSHGSLSGCLRVFAPDADGYARIGRIVSSPRHRKAGHGRSLVQQALDFIAARYGDVPVKISAQVYLERFYAEFGFARASADYLEDGILHCDMLRVGSQPV